MSIREVSLLRVVKPVALLGEDHLRLLELRLLELRQPISLELNPFQFDLPRPLHLALPLLLRQEPGLMSSDLSLLLGELWGRVGGGQRSIAAHQGYNS